MRSHEAIQFRSGNAGESCDHGYAEAETIPHCGQAVRQRAEVRPRRRGSGRSRIAPAVSPGPNGVAQPDFDMRIQPPLLKSADFGEIGMHIGMEQAIQHASL